MQRFIRVRGARTHNLQGVDLDLPHDCLTVITGVSGSGKSSLAFDTLYAEGQRQYIESLSVYARQFLDQLERPDVDLIDGLEPTLCIDQRPGSHNPRSTVATVTEIYDYLRLLYARAGTPHCYRCGTAILQQTPEQIQQTLAALPEGTRLMLLSPMIRGRAGRHEEIFAQIRKAGFVRARVDGELYELEHLPELAPRRKHTVEAVVDRVVVRPEVGERIGDSVRLAVRFGEGLIVAVYLAPGESQWSERLLSTRYACPECGISYEELEPRTFSFNSPYGACGRCAGLGRLEPEWDEGEERRSERAPFRSLLVCPECGGGRLRREALSVRVDGRSIAELTALAVTEATDFFAGMQLTGVPAEVAQPIRTEILRRLQFLHRVGVGYLSLDRGADTLSGGELQRVRLATSIGSGLVGVCYILDEPSIGLHQRDNDRLIEALRHLQGQGNTVLVVEHDEAMMRAADWLVDMGPGAGRRGGRVISQGRPEQVAADPASVTGPYLAGAASIAIPAARRPARPEAMLVLRGARANNLKTLTARFPLGCLVGVTGVSGSGKSSLVVETLYPALAQQLGLVAPPPGDHEALEGAESIDKLIRIDQSPIGRSPRSCPATFTGVMDEIRKVYAATRGAKQRGFTASRFSFNAAPGRCPQCQGQGQERIEMNFLSDLSIPCSVCGGARFNRQTLQVRYRGASIADVLQMSVDQATEFFENFARVDRYLRSLQSVGLGYLQLGQSSTTLSGGEAQRLKLATQLARSETGRTLYLLDEPTTGLHFADIDRLLGVLQTLVDRGNTVLVIEHNLDVIKTCDWLIDLGPEGGAAGGYLLGEGTPEAIAALAENPTGRYLCEMLARGAAGAIAPKSSPRPAGE